MKNITVISSFLSVALCLSILSIKSMEQLSPLDQAMDDFQKKYDDYIENPTPDKFNQFNKIYSEIQTKYASALDAAGKETLEHFNSLASEFKNYLATKQISPKLQKLIDEDIEDAQEDLNTAGDATKSLDDRWKAFYDAYNSLDVPRRIKQAVREDLIKKEIALIQETLQSTITEDQRAMLLEELQDDLDLIKQYPISNPLAKELNDLHQKLSQKQKPSVMPTSPTTTPKTFVQAIPADIQGMLLGFLTTAKTPQDAVKNIKAFIPASGLKLADPKLIESIVEKLSTQFEIKQAKAVELLDLEEARDWWWDQTEKLRNTFTNFVNNPNQSTYTGWQSHYKNFTERMGTDPMLYEKNLVAEARMKPGTMTPDSEIRKLYTKQRNAAQPQESIINSLTSSSSQKSYALNRSIGIYGDLTYAFEDLRNIILSGYLSVASQALLENNFFTPAQFAQDGLSLIKKWGEKYPTNPRLKKSLEDMITDADKKHDEFQKEKAKKLAEEKLLAENKAKEERKEQERQQQMELERQRKAQRQQQAAQEQAASEKRTKELLERAQKEIEEIRQGATVKPPEKKQQTVAPASDETLQVKLKALADTLNLLNRALQ